MSSQIIIHDTESLDDLQSVLEYTGDTVLKIESSIQDYLCGVVEVMERQEQLIYECYQKAIDAYDDCLDSQEYDEESREYYPSCRYEASEKDAWERKYDRAKQLVYECKDIRDGWNYYSPCSYGGSHALNTEGKCTIEDATEKLAKIRVLVAKILAVRFSGKGGQPVASSRDEHVQKVALQDANDRVQREQRKDSEFFDVQKSTRVMKCKRCGRPFALCVCYGLK